jgi:hypothetical protein
MPVRAVVFDIGGVLEDAPPTGVADRWEATLGLRPGITAILFQDNEQAIADIEGRLR